MPRRHRRTSSFKLFFHAQTLNKEVRKLPKKCSFIDHKKMCHFVMTGRVSKASEVLVIHFMHKI